MAKSRFSRSSIAIALVLGLGAASCGSDDTTSEAASTGCDPLPLHAEGVLTVATGQEVYPPWMEDNDPANGKGFESAVVYAIADELGLETVEWVGTTFDDAISAAAKDYDFNIQQYSITEEREEVVDFSKGYYQVKQAMIGTSDGVASTASTLADLADLKLGAAIGTTSLDYIDLVIEPTSDAAVFDDNAAAKAAFDAGQVDAIVFDLPTAYYITAVEIPDASIIGVLPADGDAEELGLLFEQGDPLRECVDTALAALEADGTLAELEETWLNQGGGIPTLTK